MMMKAMAKLMVIVLLFSLFAYTIYGDTDLNQFTPFELSVKEIPEDDLHPYGSNRLTFKIKNMPTETSSPELAYYVAIEKQIGNEPYIEVELIPTVTMVESHKISNNTYFVEQLWIEDYEWDGIQQVNYRVALLLDDIVGNRGGKTPYSNVASTQLISSPWALTTLKEAKSLDLIPAILEGKDLTKPVTREEFAELAVQLYEKSLAVEAEIASPNPFTDSTNIKVLKAYKIGITEGTSPTTFEPNKLITREQCATMLFRDIKAIAPSGEYNVTAVKDFKDQAQISAYAIEATKYMSKVGIILGDTEGRFMPRGITTSEIAVGYGLATREQALIMSVRAYKTIQ